MVKIHHTQKSQAAKMGVTLSAKGDDVEAFWAERNQRVLGASASDALEKMRAVQEEIKGREADDEEEVESDVEVGTDQDDEGGEGEGEEGGDEGSDDEGDADEGGEEKPDSSVVKQKYRAIYSERGHPSHCGDWLATILNNLVKTKEGSDIGRFQQICQLNDVDMSKYKTSGQGWQGRFRMTGRNLLAKKLYDKEVLIAPDMNGEPVEYPIPEEWKTEQRFAK